MAENKASFLFYNNWGDTFDELSDEDAGKLIKHLCDYVRDKNPEAKSVLIKAVFANMKSTLIRDSKKWDLIVEKRSLAGKASAEKRKQNQQVLTSVESVEQTSTNPTVKDTVTVNVTDTVKDTVKVKKKNNSSLPEKKFSGFSEIKNMFLEFYKDKTGEDYYWTAKDGAKVKPIISKLKFKIKEKSSSKKEITDQEVVTSFRYLLGLIKDDWILSHLSMAIIDSKFNEIIINKNGQPKKGGDNRSELEKLSYDLKNRHSHA